MARILIAEDDAIAASVLANALMNAGHAVGVLDNGRDALFTIRAKRPDIVILDGDLPMHELTVLRDLRHDAQVWHTPVFMLTASRSRADEEIAMRGRHGLLQAFRSRLRALSHQRGARSPSRAPAPPRAAR
jgi:DNA-binding response OmpR family regulator